MKHFKKVEVHWLDSKGGTTGWENIEDLEPFLPCLCWSVGFIIEDTDEYITIAQSVSEEQVLGLMTIPKCSIKEMFEVRNLKA